MFDPQATSAVQSIAAFASLHMAVVFAAALLAQLAGAPRALRVGLWTFLGLTSIATIYFGWHYVVDDVAGLLIGAVAVYGGARLCRGRAARAAPPCPGCRRGAPVRRSGGLNLPNCLTVGRMCLTPALVILLAGRRMGTGPRGVHRRDGDRRARRLPGALARAGHRLRQAHGPDRRQAADRGRLRLPRGHRPDRPLGGRLDPHPRGRGQRDPPGRAPPGHGDQRQPARQGEDCRSRRWRSWC